jgi:hypothetical protein
MKFQRKEVDRERNYSSSQYLAANSYRLQTMTKNEGDTTTWINRLTIQMMTINLATTKGPRTCGKNHRQRTNSKGKGEACRVTSIYT